MTNTEYQSVYREPCTDLIEGDSCIGGVALGPYDGVCSSGGGGGAAHLVCRPAVTDSTHGGLDGIGTDACGNVFVAEYTTGSVWRFDAEGAEGVLAAQINSQWIPNIHWGLGVGGFETDVMYVADRQRRALRAIEVGVPGRPECYPGP